MRRPRLLVAGAGLGGLSVALLAVLAPTVTLAATTPVPPPNWVSPGNGAWVAFTVDTTSPAYDPAKGAYGPVTLTRSGNVTTDAALGTAFPGPTSWETRPKAGSTTGEVEYGWPKSWALSNGLTFERADAWCARTATTCRYHVLSGTGQAFFVFGGTPIDPSDGQPMTPAEVAAFAATYDKGAVTLAPPPPTWGTVKVTYAAGTSGGTGSVTLDASSVNTYGATVGTYRWTLTRVGAPSEVETFDCPTKVCTRPLSLQPDADYVVKLELLGSGGSSLGTTSFTAQKPNATPTTSTPATSQPTPSTSRAPGPTPTSPPPATAPPAPVTGPAEAPPVVVFARPAAAPVLPAAPSVVWLWRPEDYQGDASRQAATPPTSVALAVRAGRAIEISGPSTRTDDPSAGPWVAGLGAFGTAALGGLVIRWRRIRGRVPFEP